MLAALFLLLGITATGWSQEFSSLDKTRGVQMARGMRRYLKDMYFDTTFHGMDLDARFRQAEERIQAARSNSEIFTVIAAVVLDLNDSHTFFVPPQRASRVEYGWEMTPVGESVFVTSIKPRSAAESIGLHLGDRVVALNGIPMTRERAWQAHYYFDLVSPHAALHVQLDRSDGTAAELDIPAHVTQEQQYIKVGEGFREFIIDWENHRRTIRNRDWVANGDVFIWRMASFEQEDRDIDWMIGRARQHRAIVLDMRDNPGGYTAAVRRLLSRFFDRRVLGWVEHRRHKVDSIWVDPGHDPYAGKVVILINSRSASSAEIFARAIQLEHRGLVIGDHSAGAVMSARQFGDITSGGRSVMYGVSVSVAEVRSADGASLEHVGATPDSLALPTRMDLAAQRDPVLAKAVALAGGTLSPEEAGRLFPVVWP